MSDRNCKALIKSTFILLAFCCLRASAGTPQPTQLIYKQVDSVSLRLIIYYPDNCKRNQRYPAIVFFHGGGWYNGDTLQFQHHAEYFAKRKMIGILANYRVKKIHGTSPFDAVRDAKSAIRFIRKNAAALGIDAEKIAAAGGSAGGHLAAAAGNVEGLEEENEDLTISSKPNALVLYNPVYDNGPGGFGYNIVGERYREISPLHNIRKGAPPTTVFLGTEDAYVPVRTALEYKKRMDEVGSRNQLFLYEGLGHGFFNYRFTENYRETVYQTDIFLESLGYLHGKPAVEDTPLKEIEE